MMVSVTSVYFQVTVQRITASLLELEVPGLAEKRPSIIAGDYIDMRLHNNHTGYRGIIKKVNANSVIIEALPRV